MVFLSKVFKSKDASKVGSKHKVQHVDISRGEVMPPAKPRFVSTWSSKEIDPTEVEELIHVCTLILKSRAEALDTPFLLLPFRPETDTVPARTFITNFFKTNREGSRNYAGSSLRRELVLTDPAVLCSILKWCWSRMPGGVVTWPVYHGFSLGEKDSNMARHAFHTFIPLSVESDARKNIIYDFFDLLTAIAAHGKTNGFGGRKLSRMAGWWAFEHSDQGKGFEGGYKSWLAAADASSHLFFGYLRSLNPEALDGFSGINGLPRSIQTLMAQTRYPPDASTHIQKAIPKVVMLVDSVSPGPFALLRRANNFEYRDEDLQTFSEYSDPAQALTEECRRVLGCITLANQSTAVVRSQSAMSIGLESLHKPDETWSHFQDFGFSSFGDDSNDTVSGASSPGLDHERISGIRSAPRSRADGGGRPTTPSWADFLNSGFVDDSNNIKPTPVRMLLPPDKVLPPIGLPRSSSGLPRSSSGILGEDMNPGELASITRFDLDDSFWWVWMTSLANEEPATRKSVFGRCALVETGIFSGHWILLEEQIKSATSELEAGAYLAEKKSRFGFSRRGKSGRRRSAALPQKSLDIPQEEPEKSTKPNISLDQQAKIRAAAATLVRQNIKVDEPSPQKRGRRDEAMSMKTNSVMTLGLKSEAAPAMKWAHSFDKEATRQQYLGDNFAGTGAHVGMHVSDNASVSTETGHADVPLPPLPVPQKSAIFTEYELPATPQEDHAKVGEMPQPSFPVVCTANDNGAPASLSASIRSEQPVVHDATEMQTTSSVPNVAQVGRKPVAVRSNNVKNHPAFRPSMDGQRPVKSEISAVKAAREAWELKAANFSPDVLPHHPKRPNGFKRMFSTKGKNDDGRNEFPGQQPSASMTSLTPSETNLGKQRSLLRKRSPAPNGPAQAMPLPTGEPLFPRRAMASSPVPPHSEQGPSAVSSLEPTLGSQDRAGDDHIVSPGYSSSAHGDHQHFDQDQTSHAPSWTPRQSIDSHLQAEEAYKANLPNAPGVFPETPAETPMMESSSGGQFHTDPSDETSQPTANNIDRWAQIRRNAAERAARLSEDQTSGRPSNLTTGTEDDGDTSGEETIEERVARIKARVAHLTGNIERGPRAPLR